MSDEGIYKCINVTKDSRMLHCSIENPVEPHKRMKKIARAPKLVLGHKQPCISNRLTNRQYAYRMRVFLTRKDRQNADPSYYSDSFFYACNLLSFYVQAKAANLQENLHVGLLGFSGTTDGQRFVRAQQTVTILSRGVYGSPGLQVTKSIGWTAFMMTYLLRTKPITLST